MNSGDHEILVFLKSVVEGDDAGFAWHQWIARNELLLEDLLSPGEFLRLKFHPLSEAAQILETRAVSFLKSDRFEWLDIDSQSGRCRNCGETIIRFKGGGATCPNKCFTILT